MRFRSRGNGVTSATYDHQTTCKVDGPSSLVLCPQEATPVSYIDMRYNCGMVDVVTPYFRQLSAEGEYVFSPMWSEDFSVTREPTYVYVNIHDTSPNGNQWREFYDDVLYDANHTLINTSTEAMDDFLAPYESERDIAVTKAWANVDESEMLAYATIGELPETIRWIADCMQRFIKVLALFRAKKVKLALKRQLMNPVDSADAMLNFWMELRYAVRPLAFEMEQLIAALEKGTFPNRSTARGFHAVTDVDSTTETVDISGIDRHFVTEDRVISRVSTYRAGVIYEVGLENGNYFAVFGFDKPLEAIYELTKLSFVLDWFINIGTFIASWTPESNLTPKGSWVTETHQFSLTSTTSNHTTTRTQDVELLDFNYGKCRSDRRLQRRIINPEKPVYPTARINLNLYKLVDLTAIARQIYRAIYS